MWRHNTRCTKICLCVDNFGIIYYSKDNITQSLNALKDKYDYTVDWDGENYIGLKLIWNYAKDYVDVVMSDYIIKLLKKFNHLLPPKLQFSPHKHFPIQYGKKGHRQLTSAPDTSDLLPTEHIPRIQSIVGILLYYARSLDNTIFLALNEISVQQQKPTKKLREKYNRLLDYVATRQHVFL